MTDLFVEIFPVAQENVPPLAGYRLHTDLSGAALNKAGGRLATRFRKAYPGAWLWLDGHIVTDSPRTGVELLITLDILKGEQPQTYEPIIGIEEDPAWQPSPAVLGEFVNRTSLKALDDAIQAALDKAGKAEKPPRHTQMEREHRTRLWQIRNAPAVSISIASRMLYEPTLQAYIGGETDDLNDKLSGLYVKERESGARGEIVSVNVEPDGVWRVTVRSGSDEADFPADALQLVVRLPDVARFEIDPKQALIALQMKPATRAYYVKAASDVAKEAGVLANAYNSRTAPDLFFSADFEMNLRFNQNRVRRYRAETLPEDFTKCGAYRLRPAFQQAPLRVSVVNTLPTKLEDFVEAMQRHLARYFDFRIEIIRERQVRVVNPSNIASAVRAVEKDNPDIILAFLPDAAQKDDDDDHETAADAYLRSLTLGRALPIHVIEQATLDDPDAMGSIILGILGKTGNAPFVLAEPLEGVDYVIGLALVREVKKAAKRSQPDEIRLTAIARVYRSDGEFVRYIVRELTLQDESLPYVLMRDLFPQRDFARKRVVVHHDGDLPDDLLQALTGWAQAISAKFYPVEIDRFGSPRLYGTVNGKVCQPPWGSAFKLSATEALLVSSVPKADVTPQPLHVRTLDAGSGALGIEMALRAVLVWSLLNYSVDGPSKLPVTVNNADDLAYWLRKGGTFGASEGEVPFWL
ncbi:MAG: hypothetical protein SF029_24745 [bacterium]|nr:hypothetical protein [bacterium]